MCALYLLLAVISQALLVVNDDPTFWDSLASSVVWFLFTVIGALIASRQPGNAVGWILVGLGLGTNIEDFAGQYGRYARFTMSGSVVGGELMAWLQSWLWAVEFGMQAFLLLVFPNGKLLSRGWRPAAWATATASIVMAVGMAFKPGEIGNRDIFRSIANPFGLEGLSGPLEEALGVAAFVALNLCILLAAASMVLRFRRARGVERQQMKWFAVAASLLAAAFVVNFVFQFVPELKLVDEAALLGAVASVAVAVGIAILRHRLYDIDLLINRAVVYALLSAGLALVYWASVVLLQQVLRAITQGSELAIIGSTLAVAALFSPARRRIQNVVDRRFYRRKYDAQQVIRDFSQHLRQEVDLDKLSAELQMVVSRTVQPADVSLWLRRSDGVQQ